MFLDIFERFVVEGSNAEENSLVLHELDGQLLAHIVDGF